MVARCAVSPTLSGGTILIKNHAIIANDGPPSFVGSELRRLLLRVFGERRVETARQFHFDAAYSAVKKIRRYTSFFLRNCLEFRGFESNRDRNYVPLADLTLKPFSIKTL